MADKRILIAEDDVSTGLMLFEFLAARGYIVETVKNGNDALEKYKENPYQVVITDIDMPVMDGNELIDQLKSFEVPPIIFVTTSHKDPDLIIDIMNKDIFDYIVKPVDMSDLMLKVNRAFDIYEMKRALEVAEKEKIIRLENSLEWYKFEEQVKSRDLKSLGSNIFESLLTSFNQGSGFGGLVTLLALMKNTAKKDGDFYKIPDDLFDMIMGNVESAEKALRTFGEMTRIISAKHQAEKVSVAFIHEQIMNKINELSSMATIKNHSIVLSDLKPYFADIYVEIYPDYFMKAIEEIILNSFKFSPAKSDVVILIIKSDDICTISVINDAAVGEKGQKGIPVGYENIVFEPFFRLAKTVHDEYKTLDFGLGLALAQKIITGFGGGISIHNINDYSDIKTGARKRVECTITLNTQR